MSMTEPKAWLPRIALTTVHRLQFSISLKGGTWIRIVNPFKYPNRHMPTVLLHRSITRMSGRIGEWATSGVTDIRDRTSALKAKWLVR